MLSAQTAQAARHIWLTHTLGLLKPKELVLLAERRGWPKDAGTPGGVSSRIWSADGLAHAAQGVPDGLAYALHFMALNQVVLGLPALVRYYYGPDMKYPRGWRVGELRTYFKEIRRDWLPWGWLLTYSPGPPDKVDPGSQIFFYVPEEWQGHLPPLPLATEPFPGPGEPPDRFWLPVLEAAVRPGQPLDGNSRTLGRQWIEAWANRHTPYGALEDSDLYGHMRSGVNLLHLLRQVPAERGMTRAALKAAYKSLTHWDEMAWLDMALVEATQLGILEASHDVLRLASAVRWLYDAEDAPYAGLATPALTGDRLIIKRGAIDPIALVDLASVSDVTITATAIEMTPARAKMGRRFGAAGSVLGHLPAPLQVLAPWVEAAEDVARRFGEVVVYEPLHVLEIKDLAIGVAIQREFPAAVKPLDPPNGRFYAFHPQHEADVRRFLEKKQWPCKVATPCP